MSAERYSIDTNILVYAVDRLEGEKHLRALDIMERSVDRDCVLTAQALAEFVVAVTRRRRLSKPDAIAQARDWRVLFPGGDRQRARCVLCPCNPEMRIVSL